LKHCTKIQNEKIKMKKYTQVELMPLKHGGKRKNAGRKITDEKLKKPKTIAIRLDERLLEIVEHLKKEIAAENHEKITAIKNTLDGISPPSEKPKPKGKQNATITTIFESTSSGACYQKMHDEKLEGQHAVIQSGEKWKIIKILEDNK
jgi:hypothetical protein